MQSFKSAALLPALLASSALAAPYPPEPYYPTEPYPQKALYLQTNNVECNNIIALPIKEDGTIGAGSVYATMGKGSIHVDANNMTVVPDGLLSQGSVAVAGDYLFAVNAGTNSATMFHISPDSPTLLKSPSTATLPTGDFPNTIAASTKHNLVCLATTGTANGVSCAPFSAESGLGDFDALRPLGLEQTTPPVGPPNSVSQISFTEDESAVLVTVKGDAMNNLPGFVVVYPVIGDGEVSAEGMRSEPNGTSVLFGFSQIPQTSKFIVSDPSVGAAVLQLQGNGSMTGGGSVSTSQVIPIAEQQALCWTAISPATGSAYLADGAINQLVAIKVPEGEVTDIVPVESKNLGMFDIAATGEYLYVLSPGNMTDGNAVVSIVHTGSHETVQQVDLGVYGAGGSAQGMITYG